MYLPVIVVMTPVVVAVVLILNVIVQNVKETRNRKVKRGEIFNGEKRIYREGYWVGVRCERYIRVCDLFCK